MTFHIRLYDEGAEYGMKNVVSGESYKALVFDLHYQLIFVILVGGGGV